MQIVGLLALVGLLVETTSAATLLVLSHVRPSWFAVSQQSFARRLGDDGNSRLRHRLVEPDFDVELGWRPVPGSERTFTSSIGRPWTAHYDADGARFDATPHGPSGTSAIAAFGDSFTHCDEVQDDETWEHALALRLGTRVRNFGVSAYGTDQALLRLERHLLAGLDASIVVLTIHEENINRIVNRYRPYYLPSDPLTLGFKPRFVLDGERLRVLPNPLDPASASQLTVEGCLDTAARGDYWFARNAERPRLAFPFTYQLAKLLLDVATARRLIGHNPLAPLPGSAWFDRDATRLMTAVVERFVAITLERGITPVLVMLPDLGDGTHWYGTADYHPWLRDLATSLAAESLVIIDMANEIDDVQGFRVRPDGGHPSPEGNRTIARVLAERIPRPHRAAFETGATPLAWPCA